MEAANSIQSRCGCTAIAKKVTLMRFLKEKVCKVARLVDSNESPLLDVSQIHGAVLQLFVVSLTNQSNHVYDVVWDLIHATGLKTKL